jgi:hypothetical protein
VAVAGVLQACVCARLHARARGTIAAGLLFKTVNIPS